MTDLISRADAIEAIQNAYCKPCKERGDDYNEVRCRACEYDNAIIQIDALPSADAVSREEYERLEALYDAIRIYDSSGDVVQGDGRNNIKRYPNCQMRTSLGNCDAIGGFCTSINAPICDAFHKLSEAIQGWIPCSERLPDEDGNYLITVEDLRLGHIGEHTVTIADFYAKGKKWNSIIDVYAWMPLSKPYKGGDSE